MLGLFVLSSTLVVVTLFGLTHLPTALIKENSTDGGGLQVGIEKIAILDCFF